MALKAFLEAYNLFGNSVFITLGIFLMLELRINAIRQQKIIAAILNQLGLDEDISTSYRNILPVGVLPGWATNGDIDHAINN